MLNRRNLKIKDIMPYETKANRLETIRGLFDSNNIGAKPFLKWVGGKRQLLPTFQHLYPKTLKEKKIENYYEPFLGGGAVFFDVVQKFDVKNAYLYDINDELILTYLVVQKDVNKLLEILHNYDKKYKSLSEPKQKEFYYEIRNDFNAQRFHINYDKYSDNWLLRAAQVIFLNKTCFNGLFRFNSKGGFNSPQGRYENPKIVDEDNLVKVSSILRLANIRKADFREIEKNLDEKSSFIYFDPPYKPVSKTANFTSYSKSGFDDSEQLELARLFQKLDVENRFLMLSNSDPKSIDPEDDFFEKAYEGYQIVRVEAKRAINSNPDKRNTVKEIIVTNY